MTSVSLKEILLSASKSKNRNIELELELLKKNFEKNINRKVNLSCGIMALFIYSSIFLPNFEYVMNGDFSKILEITLYAFIYWGIWYREIKKIKLLPLAVKARKAYECKWISIFLSILSILFLIIFYWLKSTNVYININHLIFLPLIALPLLTLAIILASNKIARYLDPEWYE